MRERLIADSHCVKKECNFKLVLKGNYLKNVHGLKYVLWKSIGYIVKSTIQIH